MKKIKYNNNNNKEKKKSNNTFFEGLMKDWLMSNNPPRQNKKRAKQNKLYGLKKKLWFMWVDVQQRGHGHYTNECHSKDKHRQYSYILPFIDALQLFGKLTLL